MSEINDGGNAFPIPGLHHDAELNGATLRDYFAAKAMQGICANPDTLDLAAANVSQTAYRLADAMLKARGQS